MDEESEQCESVDTYDGEKDDEDEEEDHLANTSCVLPMSFVSASSLLPMSPENLNRRDEQKKAWTDTLKSKRILK